MQRSRSALVVAATPTLATQLCAWLKLSGWHVVSTSSYAAAKLQLDRGIDLLVTELELGEYNGLQLALRSQGSDIPAVVVGPADPVLERDGEQLGCTYIRKDELDRHRVTVAVDARMTSIRNAASFARNVEFARRSWAGSRQVASSRRMLLH